MTKTIKELSEEIDRIIEDINQDLQISTSSKIFQKAASGFSNVSIPGLTSMINEQNKLVEEIAAITRKTTEEVIEFYQSHPYSLQTIKNLVMMGNKLGGNMQEILDHWSNSANPHEAFRERMKEIEGSFVEQHTFTVILPNNDRREVKASYMEVDGATLLFEDDSHDTTLVYAPGSWLWAERQQDNR